MKIDICEKLESIYANRNFNNLSDQEVDFNRFDNCIGELEIKKFISFMTENMPIQNLKLFYNNINSLNIEYLNTHLLYKTAGAYYDVNTNDIFIRKNHLQNGIWHELKHMASSYVDRENKMSFSGFMVEAEKDYIGIGLNEGYTQVLAQRYFVPDLELHIYECLILFSLAIEKIIGKDKMENFYYNANLLGVINELALYQDRENIYKLIKNIDDIHNDLYKGKLIFNKKTIDKIATTEEILLLTCKNKLNKENNTNMNNLKDFVEDLPGTISYKRKEYNIPLTKQMQKNLK